MYTQNCQLICIISHVFVYVTMQQVRCFICQPQNLFYLLVTKIVTMNVCSISYVTSNIFWFYSSSNWNKTPCSSGNILHCHGFLCSLHKMTASISDGHCWNKNAIKGIYLFLQRTKSLRETDRALCTDVKRKFPYDQALFERPREWPLQQQIFFILLVVLKHYQQRLFQCRLLKSKIQSA